MPSIETRNIDDLEIHPALKSQPRLSEDELLTWRKSMKRKGEAKTPALYVTADNKIVDGRHRYWCAKKLGWKTIPVVVVGDDEIFATIFETLTNRRHYSKGQLAYVAAPMIENVFTEAKKRQVAGAATTQFPVDTPESIAAGMGISYRVLAQAMEIHQYFETDKAKRTLTDRDENTVKNVTFKEFYEPRILLVEDPESPRTRAYGLGAVLAGIKQTLSIEQKRDVRPHGGGRPEKVEQQLKLFSDSLAGFKTKFDYWKKWDDDTRLVAAQELPAVIGDMPNDLLAEFAKVIKVEQKRREK